MKLEEILLEGQKYVSENAALKNLLTRSLKNLPTNTIAGLKEINPNLADDFINIFRSKSINGVNNIDDLVNAMKSNTLSRTAMGDLMVGSLKTKDVSNDFIRSVVPNWVDDRRFIKAWAQTPGKKLTKSALMGKGYTPEASDEIIKYARNSVKFQNALTKTKSNVKTGTRDTIKKTVQNLSKKGKIRNILTKYGKYAVIGGVAGFFLILNRLFSKSTTNDELETILYDIKRQFPDCVSDLVVRLKDYVFPFYENNSIELEFIYFTKTDIEEFDLVEGLKFYKDGIVKSGDDTKQGRYTCKDVEEIQESLNLYNTYLMILEQQNTSQIGNIMITWDGDVESFDQTKEYQSSDLTYTPCDEFPLKFGCKNNAIKNIQICLQFPEKYQTGNFGPITKDTLQKVGYDVTDGITNEMYIEIMDKCAKGERIGSSYLQRQQPPPPLSKPETTPNVERQNPLDTKTFNIPQKTPEMVFLNYKNENLLTFNKNRRRIRYKGDNIPTNDLNKLDIYFKDNGYERIKQRNKGEQIKYIWKKI